MVTLSFDVDGTILDCSQEWYDTASKTWAEVEKTKFPLSYGKFKGYLWSVVRPEHIMQNAKLFESGIELPITSRELQELRKQFDVSKHTKAFYDCRLDLMKDKETWLKKHRLYKGIRDMFDSLEEMDANNVVVTSKDGLATMELLKHFDLNKYIKTVYSRELGNRRQQFSCLSKNHRNRTIVYDDMPENLEVAKSFGFLPIAAPQGFSRECDLVGYATAWPQEFAEIVKEVVK